ncbi:MAG: hypothetical protein ABL961_17505 [Vicinamibacterales bacterium]
MEIENAQRELRTAYLGGSPGMLAASLLWCASAALGALSGPRAAIVATSVGGTLIHPAGLLFLRFIGRRPVLSSDNPIRQLAVQAALVIPLALPIVWAVALYNVTWFFPALMILVGAHYLPFAFLYGMPEYVGLAVVLVGAGLVNGTLIQTGFSTAGWLGGFVLAAAAAVIQARSGRASVRASQNPNRGPA